MVVGRVFTAMLRLLLCKNCAAMFAAGYFSVLCVVPGRWTRGSEGASAAPQGEQGVRFVQNHFTFYPEAQAAIWAPDFSTWLWDGNLAGHV